MPTAEIGPGPASERSPAGPNRTHRFDYLPAEDSWPGGYRYGYRQRAVVEERPWTVEQRAAARLLQIELPDLDTHYYETWWDMPTPEKRTVLPLPPNSARFVHENEDPFLTFNDVKIETRYAKKWGRHFWHLPDPVALAEYFGRV